MVEGRRRTSIFSKLALLFAALLLLFLVLEAVVRIFFPCPYYGFESIGAFPDRYDEKLGWAGIPNINQYFTRREFKNKATTNEDGFRDSSFERKLEGTGDRKRVVFLGDSFTWGWGVEREETVSERLAELEPGVVTFNLGHPAYGTDQEFLVFRKYCGRLAPDVVVLMLSVTDFFDCASGRSKEMNKPFFVVEEGELVLKNVPVPCDENYWQEKAALAGEYGPYVDELRGGPFGNSSAARVLRDTVLRALTRSHLFNVLAVRAATTALKRHGAPGEEVAPPMTIVLKLLEMFQAECRAVDADFLVVLIPDKAQVLVSANEGDWQEGVLSFCRGKGIKCLDLQDSFGGKPGAYFRLDPHWTAAGHSLAARAIDGFLRRAGCI